MTSDLGALVLPTWDILPFLAFPVPLMPLLESPLEPNPCCCPSTPSGAGLPRLDTGGGDDPGGWRLLLLLCLESPLATDDD